LFTGVGQEIVFKTNFSEKSIIQKMSMQNLPTALKGYSSMKVIIGEYKMPVIKHCRPISVAIWSLEVISYKP